VVTKVHSWLTALDLKLLREIRQLRGQIATIALVLASGIMSFVALRGTYLSLDRALTLYYDRYRFAHVFSSVERAPQSVARRIELLPGVASVQTRVSEEVAIPIEGMTWPAYGRLLSLPDGREPFTNALLLKAGELPASGRDEVVVLESFAQAHGLSVGDPLQVVINGKLRELRVVGLGMSPEFVYAIRPGALVEDPKRYAVLWMSERVLASAYRLEGAFNEVSLRLQPGASVPAVIDAVDRLLAPYGSNGAYDRDHQSSSRILRGELGQLGTLSGMIPAVFLAVAAFLLNLVLGRLVRLQRHELSTLKALGYTNREVSRHYLALVLVVLVPGALLGVLGGAALGSLVMDAYASVFRIPGLRFHVAPELVAVGVLGSALGALGGAWFAVRSAVRLPPAEAMRPPAPPRYRRGLLDRLHVSSFAGPSAMMVLREVSRRPLRTLLSSVGIAGAVALLILGRFGWDSINSYFEGVFRREQRQDYTVGFQRPLSPRVIRLVGREPGVISVEAVRAVPVRARFLHRHRDAVLLGLPENGTLRRLIARGGREVPVVSEGVVVTQALADLLGFEVGERIALELREGRRLRVTPTVVALVDESSGLQIYGTSELVGELERDLGAVSSLLLDVDPAQDAHLEAMLRRSPEVVDVSDAVGDMRRLRETNASFIDVWTFVSIALASSVIFGVVYNNARIALAARSRELASLRVLGYSRREISWILLGSLAVEVAIGIPLGFVFGRAWAELFVDSSVDQETFRWAAVVDAKTYLLATTVALVASGASAFWVRRGLDRLDLIAVLKVRE
jgi:putative ABC transport system permease protein